jgi:peptide-methionine (S)-S-oxide reductase
LYVFWHSHDPTADLRLSQYRSVIYYENEEQKRLATESMKQQEAERKKEIFTEIVPTPEFYLAEEHHQKYYLHYTPELENELREIYPDINDYINSTVVTHLNGYAAGFGSRDDLLAELPEMGLSPAGVQKVLEITEHPLVPLCPLPAAGAALQDS